MLEDHNARLFYVMRIGWTDVSQHISETDLRWRDFREQLLTGPDNLFQDAKAYIDQVSQTRHGFFESTIFKKSLNHVKEVDASDKDKWIVNLHISNFPLHLHEWFSCLYRLILCLHGFSPHCPMFSSVLLPGCLRERILYNTFPEIPEVLSCPVEAV